MPGSCNQLLLFTDRKGNHKSSEWHWGLESFAPFPTKQVVYMRELAIVLALEKKKKYIFLAAWPSQAADLGGGRHRGSGRGTFLLYPLPREAPHTSAGSSARKLCLQAQGGPALCPDQQVLQLFP